MTGSVVNGKGRLAGRSVVVTRPKGDGDDLADALREAGAHVVAFPVVEIVDPEDGGSALAAAIANLAHYRWVAFTSANAVQRLLALVPEVRLLESVQLAAVGPATAAALADRRLTPDLVAERPGAEGLADAFPDAGQPGSAVLFPASAGARPALPDALRRKGWTVDEVVAYRTVPAAAPDASAVRDLGHADAVTFASPSAAVAYVSCRTGDGLPLPVAPVVACIGVVTADAAREAGLGVTVVAASPSPAALVDALAGAFALPRARGTQDAPR